MLRVYSPKIALTRNMILLLGRVRQHILARQRCESVVFAQDNEQLG